VPWPPPRTVEAEPPGGGLHTKALAALPQGIGAIRTISRRHPRARVSGIVSHSRQLLCTLCLRISVKFFQCSPGGCRPHWNWFLEMLCISTSPTPVLGLSALSCSEPGPPVGQVGSGEWDFVTAGGTGPAVGSDSRA
jgi:hypothetical protein